MEEVEILEFISVLACTAMESGTNKSLFNCKGKSAGLVHAGEERTSQCLVGSNQPHNLLDLYRDLLQVCSLNLQDLITVGK